MSSSETRVFNSLGEMIDAGRLGGKALPWLETLFAEGGRLRTRADPKPGSEPVVPLYIARRLAELGLATIQADKASAKTRRVVLRPDRLHLVEEHFNPRAMTPLGALLRHGHIEEHHEGVLAAMVDGKEVRITSYVPPRPVGDRIAGARAGAAGELRLGVSEISPLVELGIVRLMGRGQARTARIVPGRWRAIAEHHFRASGRR